jgi:hypothetical protein
MTAFSLTKYAQQFLFEEFYALRFNASFYGALFCNISSFLLFKLYKCNYNKKSSLSSQPTVVVGLREKEIKSV